LKKAFENKKKGGEIPSPLGLEFKTA